ncbi:MAG: ABC transporter ATP-binding protein [Patulibacter sp.]|nr:ABC transporter ATP-binding protein [Patulibacter sp.]
MSVAPAPAPVALELRELVKHYVSGSETVRAVDGVSLEIAAGELVALFGPSGSGKSTLLMMAAAVLRPDRGSVLVRGRNVSELSEREAADYRMHELGFVRQSVDLLGGATALDNAAMKLLGTGTGVRKARREMAPLLEALGLGSRLAHRPDQLSMGERQRVMIARALSTGPSVLLADEPTGSLDSHRKHETLGLLRDVTKDRAIGTLLVTHDAQAAGYADRVFTLEDGVLHDRLPQDAPTPR